VASVVKVLGETDYTYLRSRRSANLKWSLVFLTLAVLSVAVVPVWGFLVSLVFLGMAFALGRTCLSYHKGIIGEKIVAGTLRRLSDEYYVVHDVKLEPASGNIDHIVFGPNGIFVIETKNYSGLVKCYGDTWYQAKEDSRGVEIKSPSVQVKNNARQLHGFLETRFSGGYFVNPLLVFTSRFLKVELKDCRVQVVKANKLVQAIEEHVQELKYADSDLNQMAESVARVSASQTS